MYMCVYIYIYAQQVFPILASAGVKYKIKKKKHFSS